jgi:DNA modification methylase
VSTFRIINADSLDGLRSLPDESAHCCVTSPPYWGLRDYGVVGQIGLERTPEEYVAAMVGVFREVRRVLRADGTCWMNLGDSYAGSWGAQSRGGPPSDKSTLEGHGHFGGGPKIKTLSATQIAAHPKGTRTGSWCNDHPTLKPKDLVGIPWRVAFALQADGWYLRSDIIWHKPNPMPESVTDRPTKAHEYLLLLTKSARYFYDADAIKERCVGATEDPRLPFDRMTTRRTIDNSRAAKGNARTFRGGGAYTGGQSFDNSAEVERESHGNVPNESMNRNKRSVWTIATEAFPEAHFATFPTQLVEPCVMAGCPEGGTVLDPFAGSGTVGVVALRHGRDAILIDLNPAYCEMQRNRILGDMPMFNSEATA